MPYRTVWVETRSRYQERVFSCPEVDTVLNDLEREGWTLRTMVRGTNANDWGGVYVTVHRP